MHFNVRSRIDPLDPLDRQQLMISGRAKDPFPYFRRSRGTPNKAERSIANGLSAEQLPVAVKSDWQARII